MILPCELMCNSEDETINVANDFSPILKNGDVVCLSGELGAGKTFFVKALLKNYGIDNVNSPSFAIVNQYSGGKHFFHFDFYRLKNINELHDIGISEYMMNEESIKLIEWAELFPEILPVNRIEINFEILNSETRKITIKKNE